MSNINSPFGILPDAPIATRIMADDPDQEGVPVLQRSSPNLTGFAPSWIGWFKTLKQWLLLNLNTIISPTSGTFVSADPIANGAYGDGIHDDTAIVQQTINSTGGILYLRPNTTFKVTTITVTGFTTVLIYGGGTLLNVTPAAVMMSFTSCSYVRVTEVVFTLANGGIALSFTSTPNLSCEIDRCYFSGNNANVSAISFNNASSGPIISSCFFFTFTTAIALTNQIDVNIIGCAFEVVTTPVSTSGTCTYNLRGCNVYDYYDPQVARALAYQNSAGTSLTTNTLTALSFDTNQTNIGAIHSTSVNPTRFTASVAGWYLAQGQVQAAAASGFIELQVYKNGSATVPLVAGVVNTNSANGPTATVSASLQLAATDYIEFKAAQNSGGTVTTATNVTWGSLTLLSQP